MAARDVGSTGESFAQSLAESAGIVVNRADKDKHGWDQLWELQRSDEVAPAVLPLDLRPARATCKVQVKSGVGLTKKPLKNGRAGVWYDVKLSNWIELCMFPGPAFFIVFDFEDDRTPVPRRGFLVHVDELWMTETLKNARIRKTLPHKTRQCLVFMEAQEILPLTSAALTDALNAAIGPDSMAYSVRKRELWNTVGYQVNARERFLVRTAVNPKFPNRTDEVVSVALGLAELRANSFERYDNRFSAPELIESAGGGVLKYQPPNLGPVSVKIERPGDDDALSFSGDLYSTISMAPWLPAEDARCLVVTHSFDLLFANVVGGSCSVKLKSPWEKDSKFTLRQLGEHGKFIILLFGSDCGTLNVEISLDGQSWFGKLSGKIGNDADKDDMVTMARTLQAASQVAERMSIEQDLEANPALLYSQRRGLTRLNALLNGSIDDCQLGFSPQQEPPAHLGLVFPAAASLRDGCYVFAVGILHGRPVREENMFVLRPLAVHVIVSGYRSDPEEANAALRDGIQEAGQWFVKNDVVQFIIPGKQGNPDEKQFLRDDGDHEENEGE